MLVLSRKKDECIVINNDIKIVVVEIRGDKVRLGIEAPKEVPVHRQEVFHSIAEISNAEISAGEIPAIEHAQEIQHAPPLPTAAENTDAANRSPASERSTSTPPRVLPR